MIEEKPVERVRQLRARILADTIGRVLALRAAIERDSLHFVGLPDANSTSATKSIYKCDGKKTQASHEPSHAETRVDTHVEKKN